MLLDINAATSIFFNPDSPPGRVLNSFKELTNMSFNEQENSVGELSEKYFKVNEKMNEMEKTIKEHKKKTRKRNVLNFLVSQLVTIGVTCVLTYISIRQQNKHLIETFSHNEKIAQQNNLYENNLSVTRFKYQVLSEQLVEKKATSDKLYSGITDFSIFLFRHEQICEDKFLNHAQKKSQLKILNSDYKEAFDVIKSMHDTDGILGNEVKGLLDIFGKKIATSSLYFNACRHTPEMLTSDEVKAIKRKVDSLANKNIEAKQKEIFDLLKLPATYEKKDQNKINLTAN